MKIDKSVGAFVVLSGRDLDVFENNGFGVDSHVFSRVVCFVDADQAVGHLKHVVPQRDDDELSVLGLFLVKMIKKDR